MDKAVLVDADIEAGRKLLHALEDGGLPIAVAMWLRTADKGWQFYVASPDVQVHGPIAVFKFVNAVLAASGLPISVDHVVLANTTNHFVNNVASAISMVNGTGQITDSTFNGTHVEDAVAYKVARGVRASPKPPRLGKDAARKVREIA